VTVALLRNIAPYLGDIHGQHDQQLLFTSTAQLELLDAFAGVDDLRTIASEVYRQWRACSSELAEIARTEQEKIRLLDLWQFQRNEIDSARLKPGEDAELEAERRVLQNVGKLMESADTAYSALYDAPESAYAQTRTALKRIEELCRIDESLGGLVELLKPAQIAIEEASGTLRDYLGRLEADPDRLEEVETRLAGIDRLKRKYGSSVEDVLSFLEDVQRQIAAAESTTERRAELEERQRALAGMYEKHAKSLTEARRKAATALGKRVMAELQALSMEKTIFEVRVTPAAWSEAGADAVAFFVSANVGEEPKPLEKVASGGESSRIALALKTCVTPVANAAEKGEAKWRTLVFDEVDAGVGGTAAESVGRRLRRLAAHSQVLCVTHLAQIAGFADHHYAVEKREHRGRTVAGLEELTGEARTREVGRMLSGHRLTPEALRHAEQLIRLSLGD
jgi:DNA repair protein RecN (Recombination protein N)